MTAGLRERMSRRRGVAYGLVRQRIRVDIEPMLERELADEQRVAAVVARAYEQCDATRIGPAFAQRREHCAGRALHELESRDAAVLDRRAIDAARCVGREKRRGQIGQRR